MIMKGGMYFYTSTTMLPENKRFGVSNSILDITSELHSQGKISQNTFSNSLPPTVSHEIVVDIISEDDLRL